MTKNLAFVSGGDGGILIYEVEPDGSDIRLLEYRRRFKDLRDKYGIPTESKRLGHGVF